MEGIVSSKVKQLAIVFVQSKHRNVIYFPAKDKQDTSRLIGIIGG